MLITSSGILPTLAHIMLSQLQQQPNHLQQAGVEFLQCALLAEQYRYAARLIVGTWPRPNAAVSVQQVLRYYYLRGMIHLGCNDYTMAHRCFWTCLSVPADVCSKIMLEAWKKLVLVQCLMSDGTQTSTNLPKSMPNCMGRMLASYKEAAKHYPAKSGSSLSSNSNSSSSSKRPPPQQQSQAKKEVVQPITCYMDIVEAFFKHDKIKLESLQTQHAKQLVADGNLGLVHQCHTQLVTNQVQHLSRMYSVVSVTKVAEVLAMDPANVPTLLCQCQVPCELQDDGMVVFTASDTASEESNSSSLVDLGEWMHLLEKVQRLDVAISTSTKYHSLVRKENSNSADSKQAAASGPRGVDDF
jgi:hypothetical protein